MKKQFLGKKNSECLIPLFCRVALSVLLFLVFEGNACSQSLSLFSLSPLTDGQLNSNQLAIKQSYQARTNVESTQLINLASSALLQQSTIIKVQVPGGDTATYSFSASTLQAYSNGDFYWFGNLSGASNYTGTDFSTDYLTGSLSIISNDGKVFGELRIDTISYEIPYLGQGLNALVKLNVQGGTNICVDEGPTLDSIEPSSTERACNVVNILILYTQAVLDAFPDVKNIGMQSFMNTKQALLNSKITPDQLEFKLVGIEILPGFTATGKWPDDKNPIIVGNTPAKQLRLSRSADLVIILVPNIYTIFKGAVFAFGDSNADKDNAYAFVAVDEANLPYYTFTHEVGHLFGARHQKSNDCFTNHDDTGLTYSHGYIWNKGYFWWKRYYRTVVAPCYDNGQRVTILNFSNPDVNYNGHVTGTVNYNYNAKTLRDATCRVSNYLLSHDISVVTSGPVDHLCPGYSFTITGSAIGDYGPYQYQWQYQLGAGAWITYTPPNGPQNVFNFTVPSGFFGMIYIQLTVTNGLDQATTSTWAYSDYVYCNQHRPLGISDLNQDFKDNLVVISPNPTTNSIQVQLKEPTWGPVNILIYDIMGKPCFSKSVEFNTEGAMQFDLNLPFLPDGQYILIVQPKALASQIGRFTILH